MTDRSQVHPAFAVHLLNAEGVEKSKAVRCGFSDLLYRLEELLEPGREFALARTKLEEAQQFAVRAVALAPANQATLQPGEMESYEAIIDRYDADLRSVREALAKAGAPDSIEGKRLSQSERIALLVSAPTSTPEMGAFAARAVAAPKETAASIYDAARRLYQVYAQHADWKDYRGEPLPTFDEMREATKAHWFHVAEDLAIYGTSTESNARRLAETARS